MRTPPEILLHFTINYDNKRRFKQPSWDFGFKICKDFQRFARQAYKILLSGGPLVYYLPIGNQPRFFYNVESQYRLW